MIPSLYKTLFIQELHEWNNRYKEKFGFIFMICATGRTTPQILAELKVVLMILSDHRLSINI